MKKVFGFLLIAISIIFSTSLMANAETITLTNKGKAVELTNAIIESNGTYFISLDDLNAINIGYAELDEYTLLLGRLNGYYKCYVYLEDKIMDGNETYENSVITQNDIVYVSLDAIANDYSISDHTNIDNTTDSISLWINDYTVDSYWLNYKVDESIEIGDEGFTVDLYYGTRRNSYISGGSGGRPLPEAKFGIDMTSYPSDSDVYDLNKATIKNRITHTFTNENRKYTWTYDVSKRPAISNGGISSNSGASGSGGASSTGPIGGGSSSGMTGGSGAVSLGTSVFGFIVDNEKYMGGVQSTYYNDTATVILDNNDLCEYVTVSGTVTVPTQETSLGFQVIAEGNRIVEKHSNGYYTIRRKHVDSFTGSIEADASTSSYELKLVPNQDYEICIRFANGKYVKQFIGYEDLTEDKVYNFKDFELSKTITGTIKLPDNITSLTTLDGSSVDLITGDIILQSDTPQYFIIYKTSFDLSLENKTCEFTLADDMGLDDGYIYFRLDGNYKEIYSAGVYVSNDKTEYVIDKASVVPSGTEGIILNIANGKVIETIVDYTAENYNVGENYILVQEDNNTKLDYDNCNLYVFADRVNPEYDLDEVNCRMTYRAVIPSDKTDYISCMMMFYGGYEYYLYYDKETSTWVDDFEKADILTQESLTEVFEGYKPAIAVCVDFGTLDEESKSFAADYITIGDFDYLDSTRYIAYYGENNQLLHIESTPKDYRACYTEYETIELDTTYYPLSKEIKMFIWHDNLKPIAEVTIIK